MVSKGAMFEHRGFEIYPIWGTKIRKRQIYTHVSNKDIEKIKSPLDTIRKNDRKFGSSRVEDKRSTSD